MTRAQPPPVMPAHHTGDAFRRMLRRYPTGVVVVTTIDPDRRPVGLTINSFTSVSLDPPLVLWCLRRESASRAAFVATGWFVVNVLAAGQARLAGQFAQSGYDRFLGVRWSPGPLGIPVLPGTVASLPCRSSQSVEVGDHLVMVGEVDLAGCRVTDRRPLLFLDGGFAPAPYR